MQSFQNAPTPILRIVEVAHLHAHEEHDSQRAIPLIERLREEAFFMNPPIVAPIGDGQNFVIMDGANRCYSFQQLEYPHIMVQIAPYNSGFVELDVWQHVIGAWDIQLFLNEIEQLNTVELVEGEDKHAVAHLVLPDERIFALVTPIDTLHERNAALRQVVKLYQRRARLHRTALTEPEQIWTLYPDAIGVMFFRHYHPADIIESTRHRAFLPPGISRHIIHGRAVRVNYPMAVLRDSVMTLEEKNAGLQDWIQQRVANRQMRYYAESTYLFDE